MEEATPEAGSQRKQSCSRVEGVVFSEALTIQVVIRG